MLIGMVKDTSVFTVIGLVELVRVAQNINSVTFQGFVLYTAIAVFYVIIAFALDFLFRAMERTLATPPRGKVALLVSSRRRKRVAAVVKRVQAVSSAG
jgi:ABC-type arginine/histidine transport system permease subunit